MSKRRHALSDESVRAATVISSWMDIPGLIPEGEIIGVFKEKSKRSKTIAKGAGKDKEVIEVGTDGDETS